MHSRPSVIGAVNVYRYVQLYWPIDVDSVDAKRAPVLACATLFGMPSRYVDDAFSTHTLSTPASASILIFLWCAIAYSRTAAPHRSENPLYRMPPFNPYPFV